MPDVRTCVRTCCHSYVVRTQFLNGNSSPRTGLSGATLYSAKIWSREEEEKEEFIEKGDKTAGEEEKKT